jgi:adenosylcobalamin phosphodiesterase
MEIPPQNLKNRFPFRLGTTSYILPAGYAENVAFLGPLVDDVELLFFESDGVYPLPEPMEIRTLRQLKAEHDLSYTLHLPLDLRPGVGDESLRRRSMDPCRRLVAETTELGPLFWILHVPASDLGQRAEWHFEVMERSIQELEAEGLNRKNLCLETLDYPFEQTAEMAEKHDTSLCIDIGHLLLHNFSVEECLANCMNRCRVVHLHGLREKQDHQEISLLGPDLIQKVINTLVGLAGSETVLTLEVFGHEPFLNSMETMRGYLP